MNWDTAKATAGGIAQDWTTEDGPGGAIVLELRQSQSTGEYVVRTSYIAQTMDQLHNLTPLTLTAPPAIAPVLVPGCAVRNAATFDCPLGSFVTLVDRALDPNSVDLIH